MWRKDANRDEVPYPAWVTSMILEGTSPCDTNYSLCRLSGRVIETKESAADDYSLLHRCVSS